MSLDIPVDKLEFVTGTSYQLSAEYTLDMYKSVSVTHPGLAADTADSTL
jgi:hypothetical protein